MQQELLHISDLPLDLALGNTYPLTLDGQNASGKILALAVATGETPADKEHPSIHLRFLVTNGIHRNSVIKAHCARVNGQWTGVGLAKSEPFDPDCMQLRLKLFELLDQRPKVECAHP